MEWNRGGDPRALSYRGGLYFDISAPVEFLVTPLMMVPICLLAQGRFEEPVRRCRAASHPVGK